MRSKQVSVFLLLLAAGCSRRQPPEAEEKPVPAVPSSSQTHSDEEEHAALPTRVRLDPTVLVDARIEMAPVAREVLATTLDLPGEVTSDPDKTAKVSAPVPGRIESVSFREGQTVKKGDLLVLISVPELGKTKAAFASAAAKATAARSNADRLRALSEKRLAASQEVLAAQAEADALLAEAKAGEEQLRALGTGTSAGFGSRLSLRAPIDGIVVSRDAIVGQPVSTDQTIATVADLREVWFLGRVFEKSLGQLHPGAPAEIQLNAYPKERFLGTVEYLGKQIDPAARTVVARIRLTNREDLLRLGLFGVARVATGDQAEKKPVLVVPRSAVTEIGNKLVVFVRQGDGDFDLHEVVLGEGALGKVEVLSGLREGEQAVVEGVFTLKSAVLKSSFGEEE